MIETEILRGIAILMALGKFIMPALIIGAILEELDKRKQKAAKRQLIKRKAQYELECEIAGRKMREADEIHRTVSEFNKHQTIKYTGLFSGKMMEEK